MRIVLHWIILSAAVWATTQIVSGVSVNPLWVALIVGACLTLFNMFLKPIINILTLPLNILTLGIFSLIVNGALFWYLGSGIIKGFSVSTFQAAFVGALVVSILNWILNKILHFGF
jgi:putative membrane protein